MADRLTKMLTSFINYLNQSNISGQKFKERHYHLNNYKQPTTNDKPPTPNAKLQTAYLRLRLTFH